MYVSTSFIESHLKKNIKIIKHNNSRKKKRKKKSEKNKKNYKNKKMKNKIMFYETFIFLYVFDICKI